MKKNKSKTEKTIGSEVHKVEIKWRRGRQSKLCVGYKNGSKMTQIKHEKSAWVLKKKVSKTYNIQALWQQSQCFGTISKVNSHI